MPSIHLPFPRDQQPTWPSEPGKESDWCEDVKHWREKGLDLPSLVVDYAVLGGWGRHILLTRCMLGAGACICFLGRSKGCFSGFVAWLGRGRNRNIYQWNQSSQKHPKQHLKVCGTTGRENPGGKGDKQQDTNTAQTDSGNISRTKIKFVFQFWLNASVQLSKSLHNLHQGMTCALTTCRVLDREAGTPPPTTDAAIWVKTNNDKSMSWISGLKQGGKNSAERLWNITILSKLYCYIYLWKHELINAALDEQKGLFTLNA